MKKIRSLLALGATAAFVACGQLAFADDDELDSLLSDLEGISEASESAPAEETPVEETPAASVEETSADDAAPAAEEAPAEEAPAEETTAEEELAEEAPAEEGLAEEAPAEEAPAEQAAPGVEVAKPAASPKGAAKTKGQVDKETLENLRLTEILRAKAYEEQALREMKAAREAAVLGDYRESIKAFGRAAKLLKDNPKYRELHRECETGIAEGFYQAAWQEKRIGRREKALQFMQIAFDRRHPKAHETLVAWQHEEDPDAYTTDRSEISHAKNDAEYKEKRDREKLHLRRSRQYLAIGEMQKALDECELVLVSSPYNQEAIRLRGVIEKKCKTIRDQEFKSTREGMIASVGDAWVPPYAVNAREVDEKPNSATVQSQVGDDPERTKEQSIIKRMKEMRLPSISFKPPATIIDAIDYFRTASRDFDRPEIPIEQRGFNFVLKTPEAIQNSVVDDSMAGGDDFSDDAESDTPAAGGVAGVPVIPMITASDITFYEALKLVCESVDYKFVVQGPIVMVMHKDVSTDELVTRSFPVLATFLEKMGSASGDIKEMKTTGFGGKSSRHEEEDEGQELYWKQFFELMGVKWPEGSTIFYVKTIGRLFVKNTIDNLAEFETVLMSLNQQIKLVEIETRFVEVCQEDLNSLGFEWILNSDYTLGTSGGAIGRALGLREANYNKGYSETMQNVKVTDNGGVTYKNATEVTRTSTDTSSWSKYDMLGTRTKGGIVGIDKTAGETYSSGMRYLSTVGNHISGESYSANDQFMKVNAFIGSADLSMILHMLSQRNDTDLLSAPKVLTRPGEEAVMKVVTEYIYPTDYDVQIQSSSSSSGNGSSSGGSSSILAIVEPQSFTMREVGVILQVTPTLTDDGNVVDLELNTQVVDEPTWKNYGMKIPYSGNTALQNFQGIGEIFTGVAGIFDVIGSELSAAVKKTYSEKVLDSATGAMNELTSNANDNITYYDAPMEQPFFHVRSIDSKVSVYPGATIVMGGLITEVRKAMDDKIPFLGDIPFLGRFFRSHSEETSKRNLLIFVTTRIVDGRGRELKDSGFKSPDEAAPAPAAK